MKTKNILPCEIVRFREGKKKNIIGHREDGKIILSRNDVKPGYYRLHNGEGTGYLNRCRTCPV